MFMLKKIIPVMSHISGHLTKCYTSKDEDFEHFLGKSLKKNDNPFKPPVPRQ